MAADTLKLNSRISRTLRLKSEKTLMLEPVEYEDCNFRSTINTKLRLKSRIEPKRIADYDIPP